MKSELFFLKIFGFSANLLDEIYKEKLDPEITIFNNEYTTTPLKHSFTKKEQKLSKNISGYFNFKQEIMEKYFSINSNIDKIFFKYDFNNINEIIANDELPLFLYGSGNIDLLNKERKRIAIIGTRTPSKQAIQKTKKIVTHYSKQEWVIVSGLANGIDTIAHTTAISNDGDTIAVIPTSFDNIYPKNNISLSKIIQNKGLLLTEIGPTENTYKSSFLNRNKLVASISDELIVIETTLRSGTMNTIRNAYEKNKKIYFYNQNNDEINQKIINYGGILINDEY